MSESTAPLDEVCAQGHAMTGDNLKMTTKGRRCRECARESQRLYYQRRKQREGAFWRSTRTIGRRPSTEQRFLAFVDQGEDCWIWTGHRDRSGYAVFKADGRSVIGHRWSYEHFVGPIPDGLEIDHLCRQTRCVNPTHLEAVAPLVNKRRAAAARMGGE